jgi:hypothetical protein
MPGTRSGTSSTSRARRRSPGSWPLRHSIATSGPTSGIGRARPTRQERRPPAATLTSPQQRRHYPPTGPWRRDHRHRQCGDELPNEDGPDWHGLEREITRVVLGVSAVSDGSKPRNYSGSPRRCSKLLRRNRTLRESTSGQRADDHQPPPRRSAATDRATSVHEKRCGGRIAACSSMIPEAQAGARVSGRGASAELPASPPRRSRRHGVGAQQTRDADDHAREVGGPFAGRIDGAAIAASARHAHSMA